FLLRIGFEGLARRLEHRPQRLRKLLSKLLARPRDGLLDGVVRDGPPAVLARAHDGPQLLSGRFASERFENALLPRRQLTDFLDHDLENAPEQDARLAGVQRNVVIF